MQGLYKGSCPTRKGLKMSNLVSNLVQTKKVGSNTQKSILMYMADKASDDGSGIWVSKKNMAADLEMAIRTLQTNIRDMVSSGIISEAGQKKHKNGYTVDYSINLERIGTLQNTREHHATPAPLHQMHPYPRSTCTPTPAPDAPKPLIEPSKEPNNVDKILSQWVIEDHARESFIQYRKQIKKPLTVTAAQRLSNKLRLIFIADGSPEDALATAEEKGWQSIEPDWYFGSLFGKDSIEYKQAMGKIREAIKEIN
tara:strand:- start:3793 stop:4554 length:762 start_codon:yes stop_codon:yes gene_type:complete